MQFVNELSLFKDIVADLTGVSVWLMALYVFTKAMSVAALTYLGQLAIKGVISIFKTEVSKDDYRRLDDENHKLKREAEDIKSKAKREVEEVKHLYKILKESKEAGGE